MNHSDVQRSDEGVNVSASVISIGSSRLRRWGLRVVGAALLTAPMLLARDAGRPLQSPPPAPSLRGTNPTPGPRTGPASATAPSGSGEAVTAASLLLLLVAVMASARLFLPSFRSSRASRVVAWRSATLALSVERPG
jgi:hypothetical protein